VKGSVRTSKIGKENIRSSYNGLVVVICFKKEHILVVDEDVFRVSIVFGLQHCNVFYNACNGVISFFCYGFNLEDDITTLVTNPVTNFNI